MDDVISLNRDTLLLVLEILELNIEENIPVLQVWEFSVELMPEGPKIGWRICPNGVHLIDGQQALILLFKQITL